MKMSVTYPVNQAGRKDATDNEGQAEDRSDHGSDGCSQNKFRSSRIFYYSQARNVC